ncbi:hypothetical protein ACV3Q3_13060 [Clostridium perfringens]
MENTKTYFTFYFDTQNNNILVAAKLTENTGKIATKNAIVKRVMDLFNTNTDLKVSEFSDEIVKNTKKHLFNNIEIMSESSLNNFIDYKKAELITVDTVFKKSNNKKLYDLKAIFQNAKTKELEVKTLKVEKYTTKIKELKENFKLSIHKDEQGYYVISDMETGAAFVRTNKKKDIENMLLGLIEMNGLEKLLSSKEAFLNKYSYLLNDNNKEVETNEINDKQENNICDKQNIYYTAGNLSFEKYEDAYDYCISSDFDPDLMIQEIKESASNSTLKANKLHTNNIKIKILDKQIDKLIDESIELKKEIDKQNVKYNDRDNTLIQNLENLDNKMDSIEERINKLIKENKEIYTNNFKFNLAALKEAYGDNKYKVINNNTGSILYTNNLENYLYNKDYSIKFILENREVFKQYIDTKKDSFYSNSYTIYTYKNKDSVNIIEEKEIYCLNTDKLLLREIHRSKNNINICYCKAALNKEELLTINGKQATHDTLNKAIKVFKKDNELIDILDNYIIKDTVKTVKRTSKDNIELMLKDYKVVINKFPKLKELCDNLDSYLNLYKNNYRQLFKKFKTNIIEFTNYKENYNFYKKLLQMNLNTKEQINYTIPLRVQYTTHYNKYLSK